MASKPAHLISLPFVIRADEASDAALSQAGKQVAEHLAQTVNSGVVEHQADLGSAEGPQPFTYADLLGLAR